ncbi:MAG: hypothetical protein LBQ60_02080 [Bacteroidales bacterium]|jgi:antitoxin component YwqK of YwqJK toxin-antitoxin module|nr:hypothetical protein [Bacteroidales bacterium]
MNDASNTPEKINSENKKINPAIDQPTIDILRNHQSIGYAFGGGLLAAFISAVVWAVITVATKYQVGYMAIAVGLFVGFSVRFFGAGIDKKFGFLGAALSLLGCLMGNLFSQIGFIAHEQSLGYMEALSYLNFNLITEILVESFDFMDLFFYVIAVYEGYRFAFRPITTELVDSVMSGQSDGRLKYERYRMPLVLGSIIILAVFFFQVRRGVNATKTYTYDSGQIMAEGELKNSKEHGWWTVYYENGNMMSTQYYDMGVSDSIWHWYYEDGQLSGIGRYRNGLEHGVWISYYENGTVLDSGRYLNGRKHGKWINRHDDGNLMNTGSYNRDLEDGIWEYYHENGQLSSKDKMQNGERTGDWVGYHEDGVLSEELTYLENGDILIRNTWNENGQPVIIDGNGLSQTVYDDGKVASTGELKNGKRYGMWTFFYENGDVQEKGTYENDKYKLLDAWTLSGE